MNLQKGTFGIFPAYLCKGLDCESQVLLSWMWFHKNNDGRCWPSRKTLSEETGLSLKTIDRRLLDLQEKGIIVKYNRIDDKGRSTSNIYELILDGEGVPQTPSGGRPTDPLEGVPGTHKLNSIRTKKEKGLFKTNLAGAEKQEKISAPAKTVREIFQLFESYTGWIPRYSNKVEREAAAELHKRFNINQLTSMLDLYAKHKEKGYCPQIIKPSDMLDKWQRLVNFDEKMKNSFLKFDIIGEPITL